MGCADSVPPYLLSHVVLLCDGLQGGVLVWLLLRLLLLLLLLLLVNNTSCTSISVTQQTRTAVMNSRRQMLLFPGLKSWLR